MTVCRKKSKESTKNLLEPISSYSKVTGYNVNKQKSSDFLYASNKQLQSENLKKKKKPIYNGTPTHTTKREQKRNTSV